MSTEGENAELPYQQFHEIYDGTFQDVVCKALLEVFSEEIQANYRVTGYARMPGDKWVIRLKRRMAGDLYS